jgi:hypothetical protein
MAVSVDQAKPLPGTVVTKAECKNCMAALIKYADGWRHEYTSLKECRTTEKAVIGEWDW